MEELVTKRKEIVKALQKVYDPELPVDICALGLVYDIGLSAGQVFITITLTSVGCPAAEQIPADIKAQVESLSWVEEAHVVVTFSPPYSPDFLSQEARLAIGWL